VSNTCPFISGFDDAGEAISQATFKRRESRYTDSTFVTPPISERVRATADFALSELRRRRDEDFYSMIADLLRQLTIAPSKDISELELDLAA
jgi:hypothetical protein